MILSLCPVRATGDNSENIESADESIMNSSKSIESCRQEY